MPERLHQKVADDDVDVDGNKSIKRLCGAFLGIDGEGPLASELLRHSVLASYCAFLRANGTELCVSASSAVGGKQGETRSMSTMRYIQMYSLLKPRCTERAREPRTPLSLTVAPFVSHAELLREIRNGRKTNDIADENLTALHVLASRANLNEERPRKKMYSPLVKLLALEYSNAARANAKRENDANSHRRSERMSKDIEDFLWSARGGRERTVL